MAQSGSSTPHGASASVRRELAGLRVSRLVLLAGILACAALWATTGMTLAVQRHEWLQEAIRHNLELTQLLEEQARRILNTIDEAHLQLGRAWRRGQLKPSDYADLSRQTGLATNILLQLSLVDAQGRFVGSNLDPEGRQSGPTDLSERDHVRVHLQASRPADRTLYIGPPVLGKVSQRWSIQTSRAVLDETDHLLGITVASIDPAYFESIYRHLAPGRYGSVSLVGSDLSLRAHVIGGAGISGASAPRRFDLIEGVTLGNSGHRRLASPVDGQERLLIYRRVDQHALYVVVTASVDEVLGPWRAMRNRFLGLMGLLGLALLALAWTLSRRLAHEEDRREQQALALGLGQLHLTDVRDRLTALCEQLRPPLSRARHFAEQVEARTDQPLQRDQARQISAQLAQADSAVVQSLEYSLAQSGELPLHLEPTDIEPLLRHTLAMANENEPVPCSLTVSGRLPVEVRTDPMRLRQVLRILLARFQHHAPGQPCEVELEAREGSVQIEWRLPDPNGSDPLHLTPTDGSPADARPRHHPDDLALALARALVQHLGGQLENLTQVPGHTGLRLILPADPHHP